MQFSILALINWLINSGFENVAVKFESHWMFFFILFWDLILYGAEAKMLQPLCSKCQFVLAPPVSVQKPNRPVWWPATAAVQEVYCCRLHHLPTHWATQGNKYVPHYCPHHWAFLSPPACWNRRCSFSSLHRLLWYLIVPSFWSPMCQHVGHFFTHSNTETVLNPEVQDAENSEPRLLHLKWSQNIWFEARPTW